MKVSLIDPRTSSAEATPAAYRVDLWTPIGDPADGGWSSSEYRLEGTDVDVSSVIAWAGAQATVPGARVVVYAELLFPAVDGGSLLVRLNGQEPTTRMES